MKRATWEVALAGLLLIAAGGCSLTDINLWLSPEAEAVGEYYVAESVAQAAFMVEFAMDKIGLKVKQTPQGNGVVLDGSTSKGSKFRVFITTDTEGRTRLRMEWMD